MRLIFTQLGVHDIVKEAYFKLCDGYDFDADVPDEIHLIGFSRGAFIARSLACLIEDIGIFRKDDAHILEQKFGPVSDFTLYDYWRTQDDAAARKDRTQELVRNFSDATNYKKLSNVKLRYPVDIASCAVLDTVAAFPPKAEGWKGALVNVSKANTLYHSPMNSLPADDTLVLQVLAKDGLTFVKTRVPQHLKFGFQALALNEQRMAFEPVLWNARAAEDTVLRQCWFAGDHTDIGGGT